MEKQKGWFRKHQLFTGIILFVLAIIVLGIVFSNGNRSSSVNTLSKDYTTGNAESKEQKSIVNITFTGDSDTATDKIQLARGTYLVKATYKGNSNFIVSVLNQNGDSSPILNEIGDYQGTTSIQADGGEYRFQVEIGTSYNGNSFSNKSPWTIQITN